MNGTPICWTLEGIESNCIVCYSILFGAKIMFARTVCQRNVIIACVQIFLFTGLFAFTMLEFALVFSKFVFS